ncbi:MAG: carbon storage regulator [Planctomycetota bacterium]|nr:carbon storage regulator [Planctomycetota bacterium]
MLVLTRRSGQKLIISHDITVSIVSIGRGRVQLGIEAPREISVRRITSELPNSESGDKSPLRLKKPGSPERAM